MPWSVISRQLAGTPPSVELRAGYSEVNASQMLKLFESLLGQLIDQGAT